VRDGKAIKSTAVSPASKIIIEPENGWQLIDWKELRDYKDLLYFLVWRNIKIRYHQTVFGFAWALIQPFFTMIVFSVVFGRLAKAPSDGVPYPIFSFVALVPWTYFAGALSESTNSLIAGANMLSKIYFPRLIIPITPVLAKLMDFGISLLLVFGLMAWYGITPTIHALLLPFLALLMVLTVSGIGLWLSALAIQYRDVKHAVTFLVQLWMYATPVIYPVSAIPHQYRLLYGLNPMAGVIEGFRASLIRTTAMPWDLIIVGSLSALFVAISGALYFRRMEHTFADVA